MSDTPELSRRKFIQLASTSLAVSAVGLPLVQACAPSIPGAPAKPAGGAATSGGGLTMPTYVAFENGPKPDLPGNEQGLDPAFFKFPAELVKSVPTPPGDGSTVTAITYLTLSAPPPMDQNVAWQAVNKAINATLSMEMVAAADYAAKVNVVIAGNDIPDFVYNPTNTSPMGAISGLPQFLRGKMTDLTPYLGGDAIKEYPNLAHYAPVTWKGGVVEGKLYGIPSARPPVGPVMMWRPDLFEKAGIQMDKAPANADDFKRMLQALTRPNENQWGIATGQTSFFGLTPNNAFPGMFRVPNNWRLDSSGKLVKDFESEEFKAAVGFARELWQLGVWHPNTPTFGGTFNDEFMAGRFAVAPGVWGQYVQLWDILAIRNAAGRLYPMHPFAHDGGKPYYPAGSGNFGLTYIKQQPSQERVKMLLKIADFFAAPFGSQEWLLNYFGVPDTDFTFDPTGAPKLTEQGRAELTATWRYVTSPAYALFSANRSQDFATISHAAEQAMISAMEPDPTIGLYSQTTANQGGLAQNELLGEVAQIIQGRRPMSDLDGLVNDWRAKAGNKMRDELAAALDASKKA